MGSISSLNIIAFFLFAFAKIAYPQVAINDSIKAAKTLSAGAVTLVDFSATIIDDKVKLKWTTSSEKNNKEFFVYRSIDEANWYVVVNVPGKINSTTLKNYESTDKTVSGGINFYKLGYFDQDENFTLLKIVKIEMEDKSKEIKVTPDNISSTIKLESAEQISSIDLELTDLLQRSYFANFVTDNTNQITIITGPLSSGVYFLKCYLNKNRTAIKKVMIN